MIILDTNIISALMREPAELKIVTWLDGLPVESTWTTAITIFEVQMGLELLATGHRRRRLEDAFASVLAADLENRVLPFDRSAADAAGEIGASLRRRGRSADIRDVQIAGIAAARRASLATRNIRHFEGVGFALIDPWAP